jgi:hypothetical protein
VRDRDLAVYKVMYPSIGEGFVFRQEKDQPMDPDAWHRKHLVPILKRANLYRAGTGLHSIRHIYVSLLIAQGEDVGYIADPVGHSTTQLTQDLYRHVLQPREHPCRHLTDRGEQRPVRTLRLRRATNGVNVAESAFPFLRASPAPEA